MLSSIQARSIGSEVIPLSTPFSHRSHQRRHSCRKPIAGPGAPMCGYRWLQGPTSPMRGPGRSRSRRKTAFE